MHTHICIYIYTYMDYITFILKCEKSLNGKILIGYYLNFQFINFKYAQGFDFMIFLSIVVPKYLHTETCRLIINCFSHHCP